MTRYYICDNEEDYPPNNARCSGFSARALEPTHEDAGGLSAPEHAQVVAIRAALAAAGLPAGAIRVHVAHCVSGTCPRHGRATSVARRVGLRVALDLGDGLTVEREYGATARS